LKKPFSLLLAFLLSAASWAPARADEEEDGPVAAPASFSGTADGPTAIEWSWSEAEGAANYRVEDESGANLSGELGRGKKSWKETGLSPNTAYTRRVVAYNDESSAASNPAAATTAGLQAPGGFSGESAGPASIRWTWQDVEGETGYRVEESADGSVWTSRSGDLPAGAGEWVETGLAAGTAYTRRVLAFSPNSQAASSPATASTQSPPPPPPAPQNFSGAGQDSSSIKWTWSDVEGETRYQVQEFNGSEWVSRSGDLSAGATQWTETGLSPNTTYTRRVAAFNNNGSSASPAASASTLSAQPPPVGGPPGNFAGQAQSPGGVLWTWSNVEGEIGFRVYDAGGQPVSGFLPADTVSWNETGLAPNTAYGRKVAALYGLVLAQPAFSAVATRHTLAAPPADLKVANVNYSSLSLAWSHNGNPAGTSYRVELDSEAGAGPRQTVAGTNAVFFDLQQDTSYSVRVLSINGDGVANEAAAVTVVRTPRAPDLSVRVEPGAPKTIQFDLITGPVVLIFPAGAFSEPVTVNLRVPASFPPPADPSMKAAGIGLSVELDKNIQPAQPITMEISYRASDAEGFDEGRFILARYDEPSGRWQPLSSTPSPAANKVAGQTGHFSIFQIFSRLRQDNVSEAMAYPNPYRPGAPGHEKIHFDKLPADAQIRVYTLAGELVKELSADGSGRGTWDGKNTAGADVASGVYYAHLQGAGGKGIVKVVIQL
jgi:hypothetical protein